jgi:hypothetical protein
MNKTRILNIFLGATLVVAVTLVALGFNAAPEAKGSSAPSIGFGDQRGFNERLTLSDRLALARSSRAYSGMGDLHHYEGESMLLDRSIEGRGVNMNAGFVQMPEKVTVQDARKYGPPGR